MKKVLIISILFLSCSTAFAGDWYSPTSPQNLILNPVNQWFPGNIYHESNQQSVRTTNDRKRPNRKYYQCVKYGGGDACKARLK